MFAVFLIGLLFSDGEDWTELRRFVIRTLHEFGFGKLNIAEQYLGEELDCFIQHFEKLRLTSNSNTVKINSIFRVPQLNIVWRILLGCRLEYGDKEIAKIIHMVEKATETEVGLHPIYAFPWLAHIPGISPLDSVKMSLGKISNYFRVCIE